MGRIDPEWRDGSSRDEPGRSFLWDCRFYETGFVNSFDEPTYVGRAWVVVCWRLSLSSTSVE